MVDGKRFYEAATVVAGPEGFVLSLDGRPARTPGRRPLALPTRALGEAVAAEWQAQGATVDPRTMPLTRLANSALDGVAADPGAVRADIARYAGSDLVCYRAADPEALVRQQATAWDPIATYARDALGAPIVVTTGITHVPQPETALARVRARLDAEGSAFAVAALHVMTTLTGSALIPLMHADGSLSADDAWLAAHVDEDYQQALWGEDAEASERRSAREAEFRAATRMLALSRALN